MFITIKNKPGEILFKNLKEAEMDESCLLLSQNADGLCVVGVSSCSAVIIQYKNETILAHVSSLWVQMDEIELLAKSLKGTPDLSVTIARCLNTFNEENKKEALALNEEYQIQDEVQLFGESDQSFKLFFEEYFGITPEFLLLEHDCLVVTPNSVIHTFDEYPFHEGDDNVEWYEQQENESLKHKAQYNTLPHLAFFQRKKDNHDGDDDGPPMRLR